MKNPTDRKSKNTAIYVTNLPPDTQADELADCFSKFGVLEEDEDGDPKIKLYANEDGSFNGEALVVYFKEESVDLAVRLLDDAELRLGQPHTTMHVKKADFSHKSHSTSGPSGNHQPRKTVDKKKTTKRLVKMQKFVAKYSFFQSILTHLKET